MRVQIRLARVRAASWAVSEPNRELAACTGTGKTLAFGKLDRLLLYSGAWEEK